MSETHSGAATYKKINGMLRIDEDQSPAVLIWRSTDGDKSVQVELTSVDKLQATPATSDKMMLRIVGKLGPDAKKGKDNEGNEIIPKAPVHMFTFNNRITMDNIKETLQHIIARYKDEEVYEKKHKQPSESPALESTLSATPQPPQAQRDLINTAVLDNSLTQTKLLTNLKLQQSLLKENKQLMKIFQETVIKEGLPPQEFWSTRVPFLRAYALSTSQKLGPYNVLSTIKPVASSDNKVNVSVSREKILTIFHNYPIVKKAYDDNVPKNFKEQEFWARFFSSKLFRKLRGERIMSNDRGDMIIDRYLTLDQEYDRKDDELLQHPVKKLIDLEGNSNDDPVKRGNRPDFTMLPGVDPNGTSDGGLDILRGMNRLSEKMIGSLESEYSRVHLPVDDFDKEEREELAFSDLDEDTATEYAEIKLRRRVVDEKELDTMQKQGQIALEDVITEVEDITKEMEKRTLDLTTLTHMSPELTRSINERVIKAVKINAKQSKHTNIETMAGSFVASYNNVQEPAKEAHSELSPEFLESCRTLHSTCCEFLKHFYIHFQGGDPKKAGLVKKLHRHLTQCKERVDELLTTISTKENDELASHCSSYLKHILRSLSNGVEKYNVVWRQENA